MRNHHQPGTLSKHFLMDGNGETTNFYVMIWNHPIETTIKNYLFGVPGRGLYAIHELDDVGCLFCNIIVGTHAQGS